MKSRATIGIRSAAVAAIAFLGGCGDAIEPITEGLPSELGMSFAIIGEAASVAGVFDKADNLEVTVAVQDREPVTRTFQIPSGQSTIEARVQLTLEQASAVAQVGVQLKKGPDPLFAGSGSVVLEQGGEQDLELDLSAVPGQILVPSEIQVEVLGRAVTLSGQVGFATGDPIPGTQVVWSTEASGIQVTHEGQLTAMRNGTYSAIVSGSGLTRTVQILVSAPPTGVEFVAGQGQVAAPGESVSDSPVVLVTHEAIPMPGVNVSFSADMGGSVSHAVVPTDDAGRALLPQWTLGAEGGENTLTATVAGLPTAALTARNNLDVVTVDPESDGSDLARVPTAAEAFVLVSPGGTVHFAHGNHDVDNVTIRAPVLVEPESGASPVIRTTTAETGFLVEGVQSGPVTFRNLAFENSVRTSVLALGEYDQVIVEGSSFSVTGTSGVEARGIDTGGGLVVVRQNTFTGGDFGVFAAAGAVMDVLNNTFSDHTFSGIQSQTGSSGRIEGNILDRCGPAGCIRLYSPDGIEVVGNRVTNAVDRGVASGIHAWEGGSVVIRDNDVVGTGGDAFVHGIQVESSDAVVAGNRVGGAERGIQFLSVGNGRIEGNTVNPCGDQHCIGVSEGSDVVIADNVLRSIKERPAFFGISVFWPAGSGSLEITGNDIAGIGSPSNPDDQATYPLEIGFQAGGWNAGETGQPQGATVEFSGNRVANAGAGMRAFHGGVIEGQDNIFDTLYGEVLGAHDGGILRITRTDITNYRFSMSMTGPDSESGAVGTLDVTCNWWGTTDGPQQFDDSTIPASAYDPWATAPIAGNAAVSCQ